MSRFTTVKPKGSRNLADLLEQQARRKAQPMRRRLMRAVEPNSLKPCTLIQQPSQSGSCAPAALAGLRVGHFLASLVKGPA